jgi:quercetin dioxygenase-like cupin family protein
MTLEVDRPTIRTGEPDRAAPDPTPLDLCNVHAVVADTAGTAPAIAWKLCEAGRQLDANLLRLPPGEVIGTHAEPDLDVLLLVVAGAGTLDTAAGPVPLVEGSLVWLPRTSARALCAGPDGLSYLTVHQRRPGMRIRTVR